MKRLLVVTGEGSGDAFAAPVVRELGVPSFGLGGAHLRDAGTELAADIRTFSSMGLGGTLARAPRLAAALTNLLAATLRTPPDAALLVGFSEVNARVATLLSRRGVPSLWYAPPQAWAWRPRRAPGIARHVSRLATVLPFEVPFWRGAEASVEYVGHPALETCVAPPAPNHAPGERIAVLPGSRRHEVLAHLPSMLEAALAVTRRTGAAPPTLVLAPSLDAETRRFAGGAAERAGAVVSGAPLPDALPGHGVALVGSGTATLECALLAVPPVIVYRTDPVTHAVGKRLVRVPHVGLPNLVLSRRAFPELVQQGATADAMSRAALSVVERAAAHAANCVEIRERLSAGLDERSPSTRVAALLADWL